MLVGTAEEDVGLELEVNGAALDTEEAEAKTFGQNVLLHDWISGEGIKVSSLLTLAGYVMCTHSEVQEVYRSTLASTQSRIA